MLPVEPQRINKGTTLKALKTVQPTIKGNNPNITPRYCKRLGGWGVHFLDELDERVKGNLGTYEQWLMLDINPSLTQKREGGNK